MRRTRALTLLIAVATVVTLTGTAGAVVPDPPGTVLVTADFLKYDGVAVSPGRVAWQGTHGVRKGAVSSDGSTVTVGALTTLGEGVLQPWGYVAHSSSGTRTLWATEIGTGYNYAVNVTTGTSLKVIAQKSVPVRISGNRVLYKNQTGDRHYILYDIPTGKKTDVSEKYNGRVSAYSFTMDLFGNYLVYTTKSFAIVRVNLADGSKQVIVPASHDGENGSFVVAYGDWVAWDRYFAPGDGFDAFDHCGLKNLRTMAPATHTCVTDLTSAGSLIRTYHQSSDYTWSLIPYGATNGTDLPSTPGAIDLGIDGNVLAWGDEDGLHAAPLADAPANRPRSLGNPIAPKTFQAPAHTWGFQLVTTAALNTCSVRIAKGGVTYRTLPCSAAATASGVASIRWDGKATNGHLVPAGTYSWRVLAANGGGSLLRSDGSAGPTAGLVTVTH